MPNKPVRVRLTVDARPTSSVVEIDAATWARMTPGERNVMLDEMAQQEVDDAGGYGYALLDPARLADLDGPAAVEPVKSWTPADIERLTPEVRALFAGILDGLAHEVADTVRLTGQSAAGVRAIRDVIRMLVGG